MMMAFRLMRVEMSVLSLLEIGGICYNSTTIKHRKGDPDGQEKKIRILQMEVEFFRRLCQRSQQMNPEALSADIACRIISEIAQEEEYAGCVSHLCEVAGISRALYYHYKHRRERAE